MQRPPHCRPLPHPTRQGTRTFNGSAPTLLNAIFRTNCLNTMNTSNYPWPSTQSRYVRSSGPFERQLKLYAITALISLGRSPVSPAVLQEAFPSFMALIMVLAACSEPFADARPPRTNSMRESTAVSPKWKAIASGSSTMRRHTMRKNHWFMRMPSVYARLRPTG